MAWTYGQRVVGGGGAFLDWPTSSWTFSPGVAVAVGTLAVLHIACENASRVPTSVTDDAGNVWVIDQSSYGPPSLGVSNPASVIATSVISSALATTNKITVTAPTNGTIT